MNTCKTCFKQTKNKIYCSEECQHIGYKKPKKEKIKIICENCNKEFYKLPSKIKNKNYCQRKCVDEHKKIIMVGEGNHRFNKKESMELRQLRSKILKDVWNNQEYRKKINISRKEAMKNRQFWFGCKPEEIEKRKITLIENLYNMSYEEYKKTIFVEKQIYYREVWKITNKQPLHLLENYDKRGRLDENESAYHLDHIIPISFGFENSINPELIGDITNLQFLPGLENIKKGKLYEKIPDTEKSS